MASTLRLSSHCNKSLFKTCQRSFSSKPQYGDQFLERYTPKDYNTDLMRSAMNKSDTELPENKNASSKLKSKYKIQLPTYNDESSQSKKRIQNKSNKNTDTTPKNVLDGNSKLLKKFNNESDIYIRGNTPFVNRKYETLVEQVNNAPSGKSLDEFGQHTNVRSAYQAQEGDYLEGMGMDDGFANARKEAKQMQKYPMKVHV